ncbi:MAG: hypothetical protein AAFV98_19640 [Chloroflexota bacterium]
MRLRVLLVTFVLLLFAVPAFAQDTDVDDIIFARDIQLNTVEPIQAADVFPTTETRVYAIIDMEDFEIGDEVEIVWYLDDERLDSVFLTNNMDSEDPRIWSSWGAPDGIEEGDWMIEVIYDDDVIGDAEFEVTDDDYVYPIIFAEGCGRSTGILYGQGSEFEDIEYLYAYVEFANFSSDDIEVVWQYDGDDIDMNEIVVEFDDSDWYCFWIQNPDGLVEGDYSMRLLEDGDEIFQSDEVEVEN